MARVSKKEVIKKEVKETKTSGITGVRQESQKGELFFKIVLIVMAAGLIAITLYFVFDSIFKKQETGFEPKYNETNYISLTHVQQVVNGENFEAIDHDGFKNALDNYKYVYVIFMADFNKASIAEAQLERQNEALTVVDKIFALEIKKDVTIAVEGNDEYTFVVIGDEVAIFFVDVTQTGNDSYASVVNTTEGQAASSSLPVMLEVTDGTDLNWFGPWTAVDKNVSTVTKLNSLLEGLQ